MPTTSPNTLAIGNDIVTFLSTLTYPGTSTLVYKQANLESIKDVSDLIANGGICVEVYGDTDASERRGFGGRVWDRQEWAILSMCSLDNPTYAELIYGARDALVLTLQTHATLGTSVSNLFHSQLQPNMKFFRINRNGQWLRAHLCMLETRQEYQISGGVQS